MTDPKTVCVVTGSRAEYGLLHWVMRYIDAAPDMTLQVLVTGMHLEARYGSTVREIEADGFNISAKVPMLEEANDSRAVARSTGAGIQGCADALSCLKPDLLVVLGDRFETFSAVVAATFLKIPIAHFHGGESTEGAFDESLRHCITKMSHLHFTSAETYRNRVIQLGESPSRVFNVGAVGLDNVQCKNLLKKKELESNLGFTFRERNMMVTFHPATLENRAASEQFAELLAALAEQKEYGIIMTHPNADPDSARIKTQIRTFVKQHAHRAVAFESLGFVRYLSVLKHIDVVVGNSSSGLIEAPHFGVPTVNIGDRQKGRIAGASVIQCEPNKAAINAAIERANSAEFITALKNSANPYGEPGASRKAVDIIAGFDLSNILKKPFHDLLATETESAR